MTELLSARAGEEAITIRSEQSSALSPLTLLQLQLDAAPPVVDKVNNLQILRREREALLGTLQAGRPEILRTVPGQCSGAPGIQEEILPGIFQISHLDWAEHNPATATISLNNRL